MRNKRAAILNQIVIQIILIGLVFSVFIMATAGKVNGRGVRQQIIEKQTAILIESGIPGVSFSIEKLQFNGYIEEVNVKEGKVYVNIDGLPSGKGYPFFSPYPVEVIEEENKFVIFIG
ncbi:MAG: hypothetical protein NUV97_03740 [archaeon]|nr:hypothetical protein [archaeon]MCR4323870.1 hypothetical protein [Nanoarchaeota archaeon]